MALTREFVEAVSQGNLLRVKIMLKDSLLVDTSFEQFNEMINGLMPLLSDKTGRVPIIVHIVMGIKTGDASTNNKKEEVK